MVNVYQNKRFWKMACRFQRKNTAAVCSTADMAWGPQNAPFLKKVRFLQKEKSPAAACSLTNIDY